MRRQVGVITYFQLRDITKERLELHKSKIFGDEVVVQNQQHA